MPASLQQLLDQIAVHADTAEPGPRPVADAADALYHLARALTQLSADGLDRIPGGPREQPTQALDAACQALCSAPAGSGRLAELAGAAADLAALRSHSTPRDDRWAAAAHIGNTADRCAQLINRERPYSTAVAAVNSAAAQLARGAGLDPPHRSPTSILDQPVQISGPPDGPPAVQLAAQAIRHLETAVGQATASPSGDTPPLTVTEWTFAVLAAETATRHILAVTGSPPDAEPAHPAAQAWRDVRAAAAPLRDGILHRRDQRPPDTIAWAILTTKALTAEFGPLARSGHPPPEQRDGWAVLQIQTIASALPRLTQRLHAAAAQWAHGGVHANARDLIRGRDDRIDAVLAGHTVTVDATDLQPTLAALRTAETLTAALAADVNRVPAAAQPTAAASIAAANRRSARPANAPQPTPQPRHGPEI